MTAQASARWRKRNPDAVKAAKARHYLKHKPEKRAYDRARYGANKEAVKARVKAWRKANPELKRFYNAKRDAPRAGTATQAQLLARITYYGGRCAYCGGPYEQLDHVIPLSRGGSHWPANRRPACASCNGSKSSKSPWTWFSERGLGPRQQAMAHQTVRGGRVQQPKGPRKK